MAWINSREQTTLTRAIYLFASTINSNSIFNRKMQHTTSDSDHVEVLFCSVLEKKFQPCLEKCTINSLPIWLCNYDETVTLWQSLMRQYVFIYKGDTYLYYTLIVVSPLQTTYDFSLCFCMCQAFFLPAFLFEVLRSMVRVNVKESP